MRTEHSSGGIWQLVAIFHMGGAYPSSFDLAMEYVDKEIPQALNATHLHLPNFYEYASNGKSTVTTILVSDNYCASKNEVLLYSYK